MQLPADLRFMQLIHAENERLPAAAVEFGQGDRARDRALPVGATPEHRIAAAPRPSRVDSSPGGRAIRAE